jgi:hypothetical protein
MSGLTANLRALMVVFGPIIFSSAYVEAFNHSVNPITLVSILPPPKKNTHIHTHTHTQTGTRLAARLGSLALHSSQWPSSARLRKCPIAPSKPTWSDKLQKSIRTAIERVQVKSRRRDAAQIQTREATTLLDLSSPHTSKATGV